MQVLLEFGEAELRKGDLKQTGYAFKKFCAEMRSAGGSGSAASVKGRMSAKLYRIPNS